MNYYIKPFSLSQTTTKGLNIEIQALRNAGLSVGVYLNKGTSCERFRTVFEVRQEGYEGGVDQQLRVDHNSQSDWVTRFNANQNFSTIVAFMYAPITCDD